VVGWPFADQSVLDGGGGVPTENPGVAYFAEDTCCVIKEEATAKFALKRFARLIWKDGFVQLAVSPKGASASLSSFQAPLGSVADSLTPATALSALLLTFSPTQRRFCSLGTGCCRRTPTDRIANWIAGL